MSTCVKVEGRVSKIWETLSNEQRKAALIKVSEMICLNLRDMGIIIKIDYEKSDFDNQMTIIHDDYWTGGNNHDGNSKRR